MKVSGNWTLIHQGLTKVSPGKNPIHILQDEKCYASNTKILDA